MGVGGIQWVYSGIHPNDTGECILDPTDMRYANDIVPNDTEFPNDTDSVIAEQKRRAPMTGPPYPNDTGADPSDTVPLPR